MAHFALFHNGPADHGRLLRELAPLYLVGFGRDNVRRKPCCQNPVKHHDVVFRRLMSDIDKKKNRFKFFAGVKIILDHLPPLLFDLYACRRIAVSGQIHKIELIVDIVVVDRLSLSGRSAGPGV